MSEIILDCGCGSKVTHKPLILDLLRLKDKIVSVDLNVTEFNRKIIDVRCNVEHLPFKSKVFMVSYASHILEHVYNPLTLLKELKRVTKETVIIKVPRLKGSEVNEKSNHLYSWSEHTLKNLLSLVFPEVNVQTTIQLPSIHLPILQRTTTLLINYLISKLTGKTEITAVCYCTENTDQNKP